MSRTAPIGRLHRAEAFRRWLGIGISVLVVGLLGLRLVTERASARRAVGVYLEESDSGLLVLEVVPGEPAGRGGMRQDDIVLSLAGKEVETALDYDAAIQAIEPGEAIRVEVQRDDGRQALEIHPGIPFDWWGFALTALTALVHLALASLVLSSKSRGRRVDLLLVLLWAIAIEVALPLELIGLPRLQQLITPLFWLLTGLQFAIELNLASLIPARHRWLERAPWASYLFYLAGLGYGVVMAAGEIAAFEESGLVAWTLTPTGTVILEGWYLLWPLGVFAILATAAFGWENTLGRTQALLILMGVVPWILLGVTMAARTLLDLPFSHQLVTLEPFVLLLYPLGIFIALYRYQLFDFQLVVRKGLLYSVLVSALLLGFYGALGGAGAFLSTFVDDPTTSVWVVGGATLVLGLFFAPLRRVLEAQIERRFFPERLALRSRLAELARQLPRQGTLPAICEKLVTELKEIFAIRGLTLSLSEGESALLAHRSSSPEGIFGTASRPLSLSDEDPLMKTLTAQRRPIVLRNYPISSDLAERLRASEVAVIQPIAGNGQLLGLLLVGAKSRGTDFHAEEAELLDLFSHHVATILENASLFESATIDGLTGLLRREAVLTRLETEFDRAVRYQRPLTVAMIDLDHFKQINDRHGHLTGDVTLQRVSATLAEGLRKTDAVGRYGGDEFLVLLPETTSEGAVRVCDELRKRVERVGVTTGGEENARVTLSIGLAGLHTGAGTARVSTEDLIGAADSALYAAKHAGRNQIRFVDDYPEHSRRLAG